PGRRRARSRPDPHLRRQGAELRRRRLPLPGGGDGNLAGAHLPGGALNDRARPGATPSPTLHDLLRRGGEMAGIETGDFPSKVLVVDDESVILQLLTTALGSEKLPLRTVLTAVEAEKALA